MIRLLGLLTLDNVEVREWERGTARLRGVRWCTLRAELKGRKVTESEMGYACAPGGAGGPPAAPAPLRRSAVLRLLRRR